MKGKIKKLVFFILCIAAAAMLQGCTGSKDPSAKTVGIVMPSKAIERS